MGIRTNSLVHMLQHPHNSTIYMYNNMHLAQSAIDKTNDFFRDIQTIENIEKSPLFHNVGTTGLKTPLKMAERISRREN